MHGRKAYGIANRLDRGRSDEGTVKKMDSEKTNTRRTFNSIGAKYN